MGKTAIFYGSTEGNTEAVAEKKEIQFLFESEWLSGRTGFFKGLSAGAVPRRLFPLPVRFARFARFIRYSAI